MIEVRIGQANTEAVPGMVFEGAMEGIIAKAMVSDKTLAAEATKD